VPQTSSSMPQLEWRETDEGLTPFLIRGKTETKAEWAPQAGSQVAFLSCPVFECLYEGTRGPGKTDALLMDFLQHVGQGWKAEWRGVLFRKTYPALGDVIEKSNKWFPRIFPGARYNRSEHYWTFPDGEQLYFRHFERPGDYWKYHGHAYPWQGWEELTTWPTPECFISMFACARSTAIGIPIKVRATTNPYGVGHNWVKARYRLPIAGKHFVGKVIRDSRDRDGNLEPERVAIHGKIHENRILLHADPKYIDRIRAAARNPAELRAWLYGDWNIVAGGMFDDVWDPSVHVVPNFPLYRVPKEWQISRAYDHGQSAPFSVGWWAISNGEPFEWNGHTYGRYPGDRYRIAEWYGWNGQPNEGVRMLSTKIAEGILEREDDYGLTGRVRPGPADTNIFDDYEPGTSVAGDMQRVGVRWERADKGPGSRKQGWQQLRKALSNAKNPMREEPGLFVLERCQQFQRTVPVLPRSDKDLDDVDTEAEDHIGDETRYYLRWKPKTISSGAF